MQVAFLLLPVIILASSFPNVIAYTNSLIANKTNAYRYLADCNLHWGQRQKKIKAFLEQNPGYIFEPPKPVKGTIVVEVNNLVGINDPARFEWLRKKYKPIATFDDCYLIFDVRD